MRVMLFNDGWAIEGVNTVTFMWRYEDTAGGEKDTGAKPEEFSTQSDAESWIGENWKDLLEAGVDQVTLLEDGTVVYGPMSLHPVEQ
ncbi:hypothetical protein ABH920_002054 [Catenulispora sp. EB89]